MSLVHSTIVGHFDPNTLTPRNRCVSRPLDIGAAKDLFAEFPEHVPSRVEFLDGYAECWWADHSLRVSNAVRQYAYELAKRQNCIAAETPVCVITHPESAKQQQAEAFQRWEQNSSQETQPNVAKSGEVV